MHNLMTLMEELIFPECGIRNETETKRKGKTLAKRDAQSRINGGGLTVIQQCIQRLTQRIVKFIRWLKNHLDSKRPATLRAAVFIGGALLGNRSRTPVLYIAQSWGGLEKHKPLLDNISQWPGATSPKLPPEPPRDETAGGGPEQKHCAA